MEGDLFIRVYLDNFQVLASALFSSFRSVDVNRCLEINRE
jgi:hypothetical protein